METERTPPSTQIDFGIRGARLRLDVITDALGINPTGGFEPGAFYLGRVKVGDEIQTVERSRPDFGVWHLNTNGFVQSALLQDHAEYLLGKLEPAAESILHFVNDPEYTVAMVLWHVGPAGFCFKSDVLSRLARLSEWLSFTTWQTEEDSDDPGKKDQSNEENEGDILNNA